MEPAQTALISLAFKGVDEVLSAFGSCLEGLDEGTAIERLRKFGPNIVAHEAAPSRFQLLTKRAVNPLVVLLFILSTLSVLIGDLRAALLMLSMIVISVSLSVVQEFRSNRAAAELEAMVSTSATVKRRKRTGGKGRQYEIAPKELVPGDIVHLSAGDLIPADVRLLSAKDLSVTQAILTGESLPVEKHAEPVPSSAVSENLFETRNICFMGSSVLSGTATALVVATGKRSYLGTLAKSITGRRAPTDFDRGINSFTWLMIRIIAVMVPIVFILNGALKGGWFEALLFAVSVAVGLTPEMLPMIVTVNLAKGALAMSKRDVIVKRLGSIQNFGGMDILCSDKTGTLTQNQVILQRHIDVYGDENPEVLKYAYLNSFHQTGLRNLLDVAVLKHGKLDHIRKVEGQYAKLDEIPFDFSRKRMSVVVRDKNTGSSVLICKGAVEEVYQICTTGVVGHEVFSLDLSHRNLLSDIARKLNEDGFRVVAVAYREFESEKREYHVSDESELTLVGYLAFLDPPKETVAEAIRELEESGVSVKILTGDNEVITRKICTDVGLNATRILLGHDVARMTDDELARACRSTSVFAKLTPEEKARVIEAHRRDGHVVGFLGDGINDSPALRAADVGISVDSAVDIAKESADIILLKKSLTVLHDGVIEGRRVFANIIKYIKMNASSNFGNMFSVLGASAILPFLPMQPIQILTNNLLYDISQATIPMDNVDAEFLRSPHKWDMAEIRRFIFSVGPISSIFDYLTFFVLLYWFGARTDPTLFQTGWFVESLTTQTLIVHVIRTNRIPFIQSRASLPVILTTSMIVVLAFWLPQSGLSSTLKLTSLPGHYWVYLMAVFISYCTLTQMVKNRLTN